MTVISFAASSRPPNETRVRASFADRASAHEQAARLAEAPFEINLECNAALNAETKTWDEQDLMARCQRLDVPALILHGARDPRPAWALDTLLASLPRCGGVTLLDDCGHFPWIEAPAATAHALRSYLGGLGEESVRH